MFKCQVLGCFSQPCEKLNRLVVETREKVYTARVRNEETREWETREVGRGWEIVRELNATDAGVAQWNNMNDEQRKKLLARR